MKENKDTKGLSKKEISLLMMKKPEFKIKNIETIDFCNLDQIVEIEHYHPTLKTKLHSFKTRLDYFLFGRWFCPVCNKYECTDFGKEYVGTLYKDDIKEINTIVNGVCLDYLLKNGEYIKYFGAEYFKNFDEYNRLFYEIEEKFKDDDKIIVGFLDYRDLDLKEIKKCLN